MWRGAIGTAGKPHRHLRVCKDPGGQISAPMFKGGQAEPDLGALAEQVAAASRGELPTRGKGGGQQYLQCG